MTSQNLTTGSGERTSASPDSGMEGEVGTMRLITLVQKSDWPTIEHVIREMDKKGK